MPKRKTTKEFKKEVDYLSGSEFEFIGEYINKGKKAEFLHKKCNGKFMMTPNQFLNEGKCLNCNEIIDFSKVFNIYTDEDFKEEFNNRHKDEFELLSDFIDFNTKVKVRHKFCKFEREILPHKIFFNIKCPSCQGGIEKPKLSIEEELYKKYNCEYVLLEVIDKNYVLLLHTKCKKEFKYNINRIHRQNIICPKCMDQYYTTATFKNKIKKITEGEFESGKYNGFDNPIKIEHKICKQSFFTTPNVFLKNPKCKICENNFSLGEKVIGDILEKNKIKFKREYKFEDCRNIYPLAFDLAIFDKNNNLECLLEYDGEQHYIPIVKFGGIEKLIENRKKDEIKNNYCKRNKIKLIRIPFWEFENIKKIIEKEICS